MVFLNQEKKIYGSVSGIPKWGDTESSFYRIGIIKFYQHFGSTKYSYSVCVPSSDSVTQITMSTESGSVTLEKAPNLDFIEYVYDSDYDVLNFIGSLGKTIEVTFDPPIGTWIQRRSNQSKKRVLCRRKSSLGGSKC